MKYLTVNSISVGVLIVLTIGVGVLVSSFSWAIAFLCAGMLALKWFDDQKLKSWTKRPQRPTSTLPIQWQKPAEEITRSMKHGRKRAAELLRALKRVRRTLDYVPDAWVMLNNGSEIELFNQAAQELLGLEQKDIGNDLASLIRFPSLTHMIRGTSTDLIEVSSPISDSKRLEVRVLRLDQNRQLVIARDVTELNRLLSMRQDFIANVSHELRTPLTVMLGYVESMVNDDLDEETLNNLASRLVAPVDRMRFMVDDLLTLTKLESAPEPAEEDISFVDTRLQLEGILEEVSSLAHEDFNFELIVEDELQIPCVSDEIHSACTNLITNAIRYSPDGGEIKVRWYTHDGLARFEVEDQGIGIPPEFISRLTERFYRIDMKGSRARGGTGLGLAIVKHILRRHQSELQIESVVGTGSKFYFDLPLELSATETAELVN